MSGLGHSAATSLPCLSPNGPRSLNKRVCGSLPLTQTLTGFAYPQYVICNRLENIHL